MVPIYKRRFVGPLVVVLIAFSLVGCSASGSHAAKGHGSIHVVSDQSVILPGKGATYRFVAQIQGQSGGMLHGPITWTSGDPAVVTVDSAGLATAQSSTGSATLTVSSPNIASQLVSVIIATPGPRTILVASTAVRSVSRTGAVLIVDRSTTGISAGDIVVSGSRGGLLATVTGASRAGNTIVLSTAPAGLSDAFAQLTADVTTLPIRATVDDENGHVTMHLDQIEPSGSITNIDPREESDPATCMDDAGASVDVTESGPAIDTDVTATLHADIQIANYSVQQFSLTAETIGALHLTTGSLSFQANGETTFTCKLDLPDTIKIPTPVLLGPVEIDGSITPEAGIDVDATAEGAVAVAGPHADDTVDSTDGVQYVDGAWQAVHDNSQTGLKVTPAADAAQGGLAVSVDPYLRVDVGISGDVFGVVSVAGVDLGFVEATGDFSGTLNAPVQPSASGYTGPQWTTGFELHGGPELALTGPVHDDLEELLNYLGIQVDFSAAWDLYDQKFPVASSPTPQLTAPSTASVGQSATLVAQVPDGFEGDGVTFVGWANGATTSTVLAEATVTGTSAMATWTPGVDQGGSLQVVALLADAIFGAVNLPYPSAPSTIMVSPQGQATTTTSTTTTTTVPTGPTPSLSSTTSTSTSTVPVSTTTTINFLNQTVSATEGWDYTPILILPGQSFTITYVSGSWTVDFRNFPDVGPGGYSPAVDATIYQDCKFDNSVPYGTLLGEVNGQLFVVGNGGTFVVSTKGSLQLRINDADNCLADNAGSVEVAISGNVTNP